MQTWQAIGWFRVFVTVWLDRADRCRPEAYRDVRSVPGSAGAARVGAA